jgi:hypothetical protein
MRVLLLAAAVLSLGLLTAGCGSSSSSSSTAQPEPVTTASAPSGRLGSADPFDGCEGVYRGHFLPDDLLRWGACPPNQDLPLDDDWMRDGRPAGQAFIAVNAATQSSGTRLITVECPQGSTSDWHTDRPVWGKDVGTVATMIPRQRTPNLQRSPSGSAVFEFAPTSSNGFRTQSWTRCKGA